MLGNKPQQQRSHTSGMLNRCWWKGRVECEVMLGICSALGQRISERSLLSPCFESTSHLQCLSNSFVCFVSPGQHSFLTFYILFFRWSPLLHSHCSPHLYLKLYSPRLWQCKHTTTPWWTRLVRMQTSYKKLWLGRMHYDLMYVVWKKKTHYCHSLWSLSSNDPLV